MHAANTKRNLGVLPGLQPWLLLVCYKLHTNNKGGFTWQQLTAKLNHNATAIWLLKRGIIAKNATN